MPDQFVVPQFIDAEDKILGPITARQFIELLTAFLIDAIMYALVPFTVFLVIAIPILMLAGLMAFVKINGQPFHFFFLNLIQTFRRPKIRVWDKSLSDTELKAYLKPPTTPPAAPPARKAPLPSSRLQELALVVNTGGMYRPEE